MDKYKFGDFVYKKRKELNLTQDDLGRKLGVTNKAVSKWETGETLPEVQSLDLLASTLGVTIDELLTQKVKNQPTYKTKKTPWVIATLLGVIVIVLSACLIVFKTKNITPEPSSPVYPIDSYYLVSPCIRTEVEEDRFTVVGSIKTLKEKEGVSFTLVFTIQYLYQTTAGVLCEISYLDRQVSFDGTDKEFVLVLEPKKSSNDFASFVGFNISYTFADVVGFD